MNWLKNILRSWVNKNHINGSLLSKDETIGVQAETLSTEPMRLSIYRANGGTIIETRVYDRQKDRSHSQLHIVGNDEDLGRSLSKIITMESLRG